MIPINNNIPEALINKYKIEIDLFTLKAKDNLKALITGATPLFGDEKDYVRKLIGRIKTLVRADQDQLEKFRNEFDAIINSKLIASKHKESFRNKILSAMNYKGLRSSFYPKYYKEIGIKSCVYCNSMLTVSISNNKNIIKAKFQVDHYLPKSEYPCFSISLFNLYPVCGPCNNVKGNKSLEFRLYTSDVNKIKASEYKFALKRGSIAKYLISKKIDDIEIEFYEPKKARPNTKTFQELLDIQGIYDTQKDLAEELIIKARIYNTPYKKVLIDAFPKLFNDVSLSNRVLIGNYCEPDEIHKRPMAKFTQDIARQLRLI